MSKENEEDGMDGLEGLIKLLAGRPKKKKLKTIKMDGADIAAHAELNARADAMEKDYQRLKSKLMCAADQNWARLKDKYDLHGDYSMHINGDEGTLEVYEG